MWVIVYLVPTYELCDREGCQFDWYFNLLRVFVMCLWERVRVHYQHIFWLHYPEVFQGELYTVTYPILVPETRDEPSPGVLPQG